MAKERVMNDLILSWLGEEMIKYSDRSSLSRWDVKYIGDENAIHLTKVIAHEF